MPASSALTQPSGLVLTAVRLNDHWAVFALSLGVAAFYDPTADSLASAEHGMCRALETVGAVVARLAVMSGQEMRPLEVRLFVVGARTTELTAGTGAAGGRHRCSPR